MCCDCFFSDSKLQITWCLLAHLYPKRQIGQT
uniref:Uncharacterized protein n=1 Tax=Anguilla anguilla TaxID=7936 RepID=A0A0E9RBA8_ANGAN